MKKIIWTFIAGFLLFCCLGVIGAIFFLERTPLFSKDFVEKNWQADRWPLPRKSEGPPRSVEPSGRAIPLESFQMSLSDWKAGGLSAQGFFLKAVPYQKYEAVKNTYKSIELRAKKLSFHDVAIDDVRILLVAPAINVSLFQETGDLVLHSLQRLAIDGTIQAQTVKALVEQYAVDLHDLYFIFDHELVLIRGRFKKIPFNAHIRVYVEDTFLKIRIQKISLWKLPVPPFLVRPLTDANFSLTPQDDRPYFLDLVAIDGIGDKVRIVSAK